MCPGKTRYVPVDPFHSSVSVSERLDAMRNFTLRNCRDAIARHAAAPYLQNSVLKALDIRLRRLEQQAGILSDAIAQGPATDTSDHEPGTANSPEDVIAQSGQSGTADAHVGPDPIAVPGEKPVTAMVSKDAGKILMDQFLSAVAKMSVANHDGDVKAFIPAAEKAIHLLQRMNHIEHGGPDPDHFTAGEPKVTITLHEQPSSRGVDVLFKIDTHGVAPTEENIKNSRALQVTFYLGSVLKGLNSNSAFAGEPTKC